MRCQGSKQGERRSRIQMETMTEKGKKAKRVRRRNEQFDLKIEKGRKKYALIPQNCSCFVIRTINEYANSK